MSIVEEISRDMGFTAQRVDAMHIIMNAHEYRTRMVCDNKLFFYSECDGHVMIFAATEVHELFGSECEMSQGLRAFLKRVQRRNLQMGIVSVTHPKKYTKKQDGGIRYAS
jgi:hypothetical protein